MESPGKEQDSYLSKPATDVVKDKIFGYEENILKTSIGETGVMGNKKNEVPLANIPPIITHDSNVTLLTHSMCLSSPVL